MKIVWITLGINAICLVFATIASLIVLFTNWLDDYRVQQDKRVKIKTFYKRLPLILFNIAVMQLISGVGIYFALQWGFIDTVGWPGIGIFILQFMIFLVIDDMFFYWLHRLLHENEHLYKQIHRIHHRATTPFALEFMYVHPLEWMGGMIGVLLAATVLVLSFGAINLYVFWLYAFFRSAHEMEIHSGLDAGWAKYLPFFGTVKHHDDHHAQVNGNYASSLTYLDKIFGTELEK